jgi:hypothetical protein
MPSEPTNWVVKSGCDGGADEPAAASGDGRRGDMDTLRQWQANCAPLAVADCWANILDGASKDELQRQGLALDRFPIPDSHPLKSVDLQFVSPPFMGAFRVSCFRASNRVKPRPRAGQNTRLCRVIRPLPRVGQLH